MEKRYTVFVSSTYLDLKAQRDQVIQAIMRAGHIPLGMEAFGAANASQWNVIKKTIDASDYYVLLIARRYGSVNPNTDMGFTEQEFDYAVAQHVPCLVFILDEAADWSGTYTDTDADPVARLKAFKKKSSTDRQIAFWSKTQELPFLVMTALGNAFSDDPRDGWVRPLPVAGPGVAEEMARLSKENAELKESLARLNLDADNERFINILKKKEFILGSVKLNALAVFIEFASTIVSQGTRLSDLNSKISTMLDFKGANDVSKSIASEAIDFLSQIGLMRAETVGIEPTRTLSLGNGGFTTTGGYTHDAYVLTDEGRRTLSYITLEKEIADSVSLTNPAGQTAPTQ